MSDYPTVTPAERIAAAALIAEGAILSAEIDRLVTGEIRRMATTLDPHPWAVYVWPHAPRINASMRYATEEEARRQATGSCVYGFKPRPEYSQRREDYTA